MNCRLIGKSGNQDERVKAEEQLSGAASIDISGVAGFQRRFGPEITPHGVVFNLWAPSADSVELMEAGRPARRMPKDADGWYQVLSSSAHKGTRYQFRINGDLLVPDPASRFQPEDVGSPSEVFDAAVLRDPEPFLGRPWQDMVIYELHVGAFTEDGTFEGVESKLEYLKTLGVTAVELMPLNDVPGGRNWGYDGVLLFAPNARYGRPEDLKRLVSAAHSIGIVVYLDVVYNHFGPQLNYLHSYAKPFFSARHTTGWGPAVNLEGRDGGFVRQFLIENALMWLGDYGFDGLRLDAVHALRDDSETHFLVELAETLRSRFPKRHIHLMLENEANQANLLRRAAGVTPLYDAQWGDDFHNALHVLLTGETEGYYKAFADKPLWHLTRALTDGFSYQGEIFPLHQRARGEKSSHLPPQAFVFFAQNHDQIGNRAMGDRLSVLVDPAKLELALVLLLLNPHIPMLFMGEEAGAKTPFLFFTDWSGEIAELTRQGRRKEFARFKSFSSPEAQRQIPDPSDERTFLASKLDWNAMQDPESAAWVRLTSDLIALRRERVLPLIREGIRQAESSMIGQKDGSGGIDVSWHTTKGNILRIIANFSDRSLAMPNLGKGETIWPRDEMTRLLLRPAEILVRLERPA
jgi:maltooligosyltrehalose trehalohydrolase